MRYMALGGIVLLAGCAAGWTALPRAGTTAGPEAPALQMQQLSLAQVKQMEADQSTVQFDSSKASGTEATIPLDGNQLTLKKQADGKWVTDTGVPLALVATGNVGGAPHLAVVEDSDAHTVCDITTKLSAMLGKAFLGTLKGSLSDWKSSDDVVVACYRLGSYLPSGSLAQLVSFELTGLRVYFVPKDGAGSLDQSREAFAFWNYFDLYHPSGSGYAARVKIVP